MAWRTPPPLVFGSGYSRPTTIRPPLALDPNRKYPLLLVLANYGATGANVVSRLQLDGAVSFADGAFICCPDAAQNGSGFLEWNYWSGTGAGTDLDYIINGLVVPIMTQCPIDPKRVYAVGYSNGGFTVQQLVKARPDLFTAAFTLAGTPLWADPSTALSKTVPMVHWHGDSDTTVLYAGQQSGASLPGNMNGHGYIGGIETGALHAGWNGVGGSLQAAYDSIDFSTSVVGNETSRKKYSGTTSENAIEVWTGVGHDHTISLPSTQKGDSEIWKWFTANHRTT